MADWNVYVENQVCVELDAESHATLVEIRDLLKQVLERLPPAQQQKADGKD